MPGEERATPRWLLDLLWLLFLLALALLPPVRETHKQVILLFIGAFQLLEGRFVAVAPKGGRHAAVIIKIVLATVLINHTGDLGINSSYYPIYYLPVMTAAMYFGPWETLLWTALASGSYLSYLFWVLRDYSLDTQGRADLALRIVFFFLVGTIVNRFVSRYRLQTLRYQATARDLSEANKNLKKAQAEAQRAERLAALGQLSAGLAHEIRNPLGVIKGSAEMLKEKVESSNPLAKELSSYIYTEVNRLSALVGRFLDFARPSQLVLISQDLPQLVDKSLKYVMEQPVAARVKVEREYAAGLPPVMLDEQLCDQVFTNLLSNACEAMGEQGGTLKIRIHPTNPGNQDVMVEIEDTGPGVPADLKEQIFNPFFTTKKTGVGLGLAIVTKIVDAHGGSVRVTSQPGRGACFQICFPATMNHM